MHKFPTTGEFYAEFSDDEKCWCVFHTENAFAYNCCINKEEAEEIAREKNQKMSANA